MKYVSLFLNLWTGLTHFNCFKIYLQALYYKKNKSLAFDNTGVILYLTKFLSEQLSS